MGRTGTNGTVMVRIDSNENEGCQTSEWWVFSALIQATITEKAGSI